MAVQRRLLGKRALVYGGGTGIGFACAEAFAREGAAVFVSSRREEVLRKAVDRLTAHGRAGQAAGGAGRPAGKSTQKVQNNPMH